MSAADSLAAPRRRRSSANASRKGKRRTRRAGVIYSSFVSFLKTLLILIALSLVLIVAIWPQLTAQDDGFRIGIAAISPEDAKNLAMLSPRYVGVDEKGRPYALTADEARQASGDDDVINLKAPKADITLKDGAWITLSADYGNYFRDKKLVDLFGAVDMFHDNGFEFHTTEAQFDLGRKSATGDKPVRGQGPLGTVESEGFRIYDNGNRIIFTGVSHMLIYPKAQKRNGG